MLIRLLLVVQRSEELRKVFLEYLIQSQVKLLCPHPLLRTNRDDNVYTGLVQMKWSWNK
jgi:hypothetical protein